MAYDRGAAVRRCTCCISYSSSATAGEPLSMRVLHLLPALPRLESPTMLKEVEGSGSCILDVGRPPGLGKQPQYLSRFLSMLCAFWWMDVSGVRVSPSHQVAVSGSTQKYTKPAFLLETRVFCWLCVSGSVPYWALRLQDHCPGKPMMPFASPCRCSGKRHCLLDTPPNAWPAPQGCSPAPERGAPGHRSCGPAIRPSRFLP